MEDPTELHEAASLGNHELLETLLLQGQYDVDSEDWTYGRKTPLHVAVESGEIFQNLTQLLSANNVMLKLMNPQSSSSVQFEMR